MKKIILIIVVSAGFLHAEPPATNGLDKPIMPPAKSQCPPSNRPGWHQRDDGKWIKN
jgi:hypothetical protein